jgi:hypothetical protein
MPCMGRPARPRPPPPSLASPHLNLRDLVFNFIKIIVFEALSFFLLRIFFSRTKSFIDIDLKFNFNFENDSYHLVLITFLKMFLK